MDKEIEAPRLEIDARGKGKHLSSRVGTYSDVVTMELAKRNGQHGKQTSVRDIVKVQYGRYNEDRERYVRSRISDAAARLLEEGIPAYPIYDEMGRHKVIGIKVVTEYSEDDVRKLRLYRDAAEQRGEIASDKAKKIEAVILALQASQSETQSQESENPTSGT